VIRPKSLKRKRRFVPNGAKTNAKACAYAVKVAKAMEMRIEEKTFEEIAKAVGWKDKTSAFNAIRDALEATVAEPAERLRKIELMKLARIERALWPMIDAGNLDAIQRMPPVLKRRAALLGLDAPTKLSNHDGSNLGPVIINVVKASEA